MGQRGTFRANNLSKAARRAAFAKGIKSATTWNALSNAKVTSERDEARQWDVPVAEVFGTHDSQAVITAGDIYTFSAGYTDAPMCRV